MYTLGVATRKWIQNHQGEIGGAVLAVLFFLGYGLISHGAPEASSSPVDAQKKNELTLWDLRATKRFSDIFGYEDSSVEYESPNPYGNDLDVTILLEGGTIEKLSWNKVVAETVNTERIRYVVLSANGLNTASDWQPYIEQFATLFGVEKQRPYSWTMDAILAHLREQKMPQGLYAGPKTADLKPILVLTLEEDPTLNFSVQWVLEFDRETASENS